MPLLHGLVIRTTRGTFNSLTDSHSLYTISSWLTIYQTFNSLTDSHLIRLVEGCGSLKKKDFQFPNGFSPGCIGFSSIEESYKELTFNSLTDSH